MEEKFEQNMEQTGEEENFADMLEASLSSAGARLKPGQKVTASILQVGDEWTFLDVGQKGEGVLDSKELADVDGKVTAAPGDRLEVYFLSGKGGELRFTNRIGGNAAGTAQMEEAWRNGIPVEGRIEKEIKGGFEVRLAGGVRSFCPFSQLGIRRQEDEDICGQSLSFKISQFSENGRNIVVSHRAILDEERARKREELKQTLKPGQIVKGRVTNIKEFGAFIDIGGIEGLLPLGEIAYGRVEDIHAHIRTGEELEVAVKSCDWDSNRFSFSLRDTLADPWNRVGSAYVAGGTYTGKVARLTNFGAFVTLEEGIDGLIHISRLGGGKRIKDPREVIQQGQELTVTIEKIDKEQKRLSLVPVDEGAAVEEELPVTHEEKPSPKGMGTLGELLLAKQKKKKKR